MLAPHAPGLAPAWQVDGVEVETFRYAPERWELLGYGRSLEADERMRGAALAVAPLYLVAARRAVVASARRVAADVVQAHWLVPNGVALAGLGRRLALVHGLHGSDVFLAERPEIRPLVRAALRSARGLTACSPEFADRVARLGMPRERMRVVPYGVDGERFAPDAERRPSLRQRFGFAAGAVVLLAVGRMVTKKGFHRLVEVLPELLAGAPELLVVFAGEGDLRGELEAATAAHRARVRFLGAVDHATLPDLYRAADLFALPAVHDRKGNVDGLPNVILEAMASGLPVVSSAISGIPLAVVDGEAGILVPEDDRRALFDALRALVADRERRLRMGAAGRRRALAELSWATVARGYRLAYRAALAAPREATAASA